MILQGDRVLAAIFRGLARADLTTSSAHFYPPSPPLSQRRRPDIRRKNVAKSITRGRHYGANDGKSFEVRYRK